MFSRGFNRGVFGCSQDEGRCELWRMAGWLDGAIGIGGPWLPFSQVTLTPEVQTGSNIRKIGFLQLRNEIPDCFLDRAEGSRLKIEAFVMKDRDISLLNPENIREPVEDAIPFVLCFNLMPLDHPPHIGIP